MADSQPIYLDNHATTRCDPRVVEAMLPFFDVLYANAGSVTHEAGQTVERQVADCRARIASAIGASKPAEIVFTSGATESNALAILGFCNRLKSGHILSLATEHPSVLAPLDRLERSGFAVTRLPVRQNAEADTGRVDLEQLRNAFRSDTVLVTAMLANHETGTIQPIGDIAALCRERGVALHSDATQAIGKMPVDVAQLGVDLLSFTAHKIHGPKGIGGLYVRGSGGRRVRVEGWIEGGGQEGGRRGGTLNTPGIVGLTTALELALAEGPGEWMRTARLRDRLWDSLSQRIPGMVLNGPALGDSGRRLVNNLNCRFPGVVGHALMVRTAGRIALSSGSACTATNSEPSHVLRALGLTDDEVRCSLRFGLGRFNDREQIDLAVELLGEAWQSLKGLAGA